MMREYTEAETERTITVSRVYRVEDAMETIYGKYNKTPCNTKIVKGQGKSFIMMGVSYQAPIQFTMKYLAIEAPGS